MGCVAMDHRRVLKPSESGTGLEKIVSGGLLVALISKYSNAVTGII